MDKAYPKSKFIGFDNHPASVERAREQAKERGLSGEQIRFEVSFATANDKTEDNLNQVGRMFYAASTMECVSGSMESDEPSLGAQAGESKIGEVV